MNMVIFEIERYSFRLFSETTLFMHSRLPEAHTWPRFQTADIRNSTSFLVSRARRGSDKSSQLQLHWMLSLNIFVHPWLCKTPTSKQTTNYGWCDHFDPDRESNMMAQSPFFSQHNYTYMDRDIILDPMINIQYSHILHSSITSRSSVVATPMQRWSSPQHVASSLRPHTHTH